ncbi:putative pyrroloquinoline-quinone binding quinoprotein [Jatrophihabitans sp. GAS493]|uniref:outer membrane protein assembly factor BamB family protein n=1 Tax=Jatrophihabitans sp. GAS493 TaxID=1907575 RepID=UPI000BB93F52|nr:PQQ-binding-like beta-propeller repeat protein [Jatrophihabitans sp. GAS493]SOD73166.1 putative pyrroloquinoline-quinone binding quinoprotein [Jatrophihabitans sp. GAS493]
MSPADPATNPALGSATGSATDSATASAEETAGDPATEFLADFNAATRRARRRYVAAITLITAATVATFLIIVARGEISHVSSRTAASAPATVTAAPRSNPLTVAWRSDDATAIGQPFFGGTVVTYSAHTVTGRDARTGSPRWTFTRTDRALCSVIQESGKTQALYSAKGNCDELTTLDTGTGQRIQERTLDDEGNLVIGTPIVIPDSLALTLATSTLVRTIRMSDGLNGWTYVAPAQCQNLRVVRGAAGVLISQHCTNGDYLLLRDLTAPDKSGDNPTDPVKWRIRTSAVVPAAADSFVAALDSTTRTLIRYQPSNGSVLATDTVLTPAPSPLRPVLQTESTNGELIWIGDTVYAVDTPGARQVWSKPASTLPTFSGPGTATGSADLSTLALPTSTGIAILNPSSGAVTESIAVNAPPADSRIITVGSGFLVAASSTTVYK